MTKDEKRGKLIFELRKKKGLTQQELGELIHYSDKNISKWECGKSFPTNPNVINDLASILDVSLEEIMYGELKENVNVDIINDNLKKSYLKDYNKYTKTIKNFLILILFLIIFIFILIYLIYIKNSIRLYSANIEGKNFENGKITILFTTKMNVMSLEKLISKQKKIEIISLYYKNNFNQEIIIFTGENQTYYIEDKQGYKEYDFESIVNSECYLKVVYDDSTEEKINLQFEIDYNNDNVFPKTVSEILTDSNNFGSEKNCKIQKNKLTN